MCRRRQIILRYWRRRLAGWSELPFLQPVYVWVMGIENVGQRKRGGRGRLFRAAATGRLGGGGNAQDGRMLVGVLALENQHFAIVHLGVGGDGMRLVSRIEEELAQLVGRREDLLRR